MKKLSTHNILRTKWRVLFLPFRAGLGSWNLKQGDQVPVVPEAGK